MTALTTQLGALAFFATVLMATDAQAQVAKASSPAKSPPPYLVDIAWDAAGQFRVNKSIAAGKFIEVCGKLPAHAKVRWQFETSGATDFNIHYHVGKDVVYPNQQMQVTSAQDELLTTRDEDYCWMWTNQGAAATTLTVRLSR